VKTSTNSLSYERSAIMCAHWRITCTCIGDVVIHISSTVIGFMLPGYVWIFRDSLSTFYMIQTGPPKRISRSI